MTSAAIYVRASLDKTGKAESVERQEAACRTLADLRGYPVAEVLADNDRSGTGTVARPAFERLLDGIEAGRFGVVIATEFTRLTRNRRDELRLIEAAQASRVPIALVRGQDIDTTTASGRMVAEILASVARQEIEQMAERLSSGLRQRAEQGRPHWSARPYGFELSGAHRADEAERLAQGYRAVLDGASLADVGRLLDVPRGSVLKILKAERNAGLRAHKGEVVGAASWAPIVDEATWRAVQDVLADPSRDAGGRTPEYLLTGLAVGPTGESVRTVKSHGRTAYSAPGVVRQARDADRAVALACVSLLAHPVAREVLTEREGADVSALRIERAGLVKRRDVDLADALAQGLSVAQVAGATRTINARVAEIDTALLDDTRSSVFARFWDGTVRDLLRDGPVVWEGLPLHERRTIVGTLWARVQLLPGRGRVVDLTPTPAAAAIQAAPLPPVTDPAQLALMEAGRALQTLRTRG